jgi:hypothetical protein
VILFLVNEMYVPIDEALRLDSLGIPSVWSVEAHAVDPYTMIGRVNRYHYERNNQGNHPTVKENICLHKYGCHRMSDTGQPRAHTRRWPRIMLAPALCALMPLAHRFVLTRARVLVSVRCGQGQKCDTAYMGAQAAEERGARPRTWACASAAPWTMPLGNARAGLDSSKHPQSL